MKLLRQFIDDQIARKRLKSHAAFARYVGVNQSVISRLMSEVKPQSLRFDTLEKIALRTETDIGELARLVAPAAVRNGSDNRTILELVDKAAPEDLQLLVDFARRLTESQNGKPE